MFNGVTAVFRFVGAPPDGEGTLLKRVVAARDVM